MKRRISIPAFILMFCLIFSACQKEPACEHQFTTKTEKAATCQAGAVLKLSCQLCGITITQTTAPGEHRFSETQTQEATCVDSGIILKTCADCGAVEELYTSTIDHQFDVYSVTPCRCTCCGQTIADAANVPDNPWYGKNWAALGTSLSSTAQGTYFAPLAERTGLKVTALGIPGGTANAKILQAAQTADLSQADLITIEFGVNDWFGDIPLGSVGDTAPYYEEIETWNNGGTEEGTFAGACYQIFHTLQTRAPQAVIVFLTEPTGRSYNGTDCSLSSTNHIGLTQSSYTETAAAIARHMGIRVIDAGSASMINQYHPEYLADQIHHSELGGQQYALNIWLELRNVAPLLKAE